MKASCSRLNLEGCLPPLFTTVSYVLCPESFNYYVPPLPSVISWLNAQQCIFLIACGPGSCL